MKKIFRGIAILPKIRSLFSNQSGYTLIEVLATMLISGIIALGALMANGQVLNQTVKNNDYTTANTQVLNAMQWISRDAQMAQSVQGAPGFPATANLTFSWTTWENRFTQVIYSVDDGQLKRKYIPGDDPAQILLIAQYIERDPASSNCTWNNQELILTLTGTVGQGPRAVSITKQKTIIPRPIL